MKRLKSHRRSVFVVTAGLVLAALCLVPLVAGRPAQAAGVQLRFVVDRDPADFADVIAAFEREHPGVTIDVQRIPWQQFFERVETMIAGGRMPDLLYTPILATGRYATLGILLDITDRIPVSMRQDFLDGPLNTVTFDGRVYGLPHFSDDIAIFYNKDAFARAGVTPPTVDDRWSWDELLAAARRVKEANGMPYGITTGSDISQWLPFLYQAGGRVLNEDHTGPAIDRPESLRAIAWFQSWFREGLAPSGVFAGAEQGEVLFEQGRVPMIVTFSGYISRFASNVRDFDFGVLPMPQDRYVANKLGGYNVVGFEATEHPDEVYAFMAFLTRPEWMARFVQANGVFPTRYSAWDLVDYGPFTDDMDIIWSEVQAVPEFAVRDFSTPVYLGYKPILTSEIQLVVLGQKEPEQAAQAMADQIRRSLFR